MCRLCMQHGTILPHSSIVLYFLAINANFCVNKNHSIPLFFSINRNMILLRKPIYSFRKREMLVFL